MLFVMCMVAVAEYFGIHEVIFPEIAALAFGAWVVEERPWPGAAWTIWFSPTLGAVSGTLILRLASTALPVMVILAFLFILIELRLFRSAMSPSFSAAILPIITGMSSWIYPLAVCVLSAIIALAALYRERCTGRTCAAAKKHGHATRKSEIAHYAKLILFVLLVATASTQSRWTFIMAPPLIVAFVELAEPGSALRKKSLPRLLCLFTLAALEGMLWVWLMRFLRGPLWLAAGLAVATAFLIVRALKVGAPPAFALALLPTILPPEILFMYPVHVLIGSLLFILFACLGFRQASFP